MFSRFLSNKYILATCAMVALSAYTLIASASVTYQPGETLEPGPSCLPDGSCTVVLPSGVAIGDTVTDVTPGSVLFGNASGHLAQDNSNLFYNGSSHRLGIGTNSPSAKLHIVAAAVPGAVGSTTYSGTGLDDATFGGAYTGTQEGCSILLGIASLGTGGSGNDEFIYGYSDNACGDGSNTPTEITPGVAQDLGNGVTVTFASGTGHTALIMDPLDNYWTASLTPPGSAENALLIKNNSGDTLFQVAGNGKVTIGGVEYTFPGSAPASDGYVLSGTTAGVLSWVAQDAGVTLLGSTSSLDTETWLGENAGSGASSDKTVMIGYSAGLNAASSTRAVFMGYEAGSGSSNTTGSVFLGAEAGKDASNTTHGVFIGDRAGYNASGTNSSVFIGDGAGYLLANGFSNVLLGYSTGYQASTVDSSVIVGSFAGQELVSSSSSLIMGFSAGLYASVDNSFIGGTYAGASASLNTSVVIGSNSASNANLLSSVAIGDSASSSAFGAGNVMIGTGAGADNSTDSSVLVGIHAGYHSDYQTHTTFIGAYAGTGGSYNDRSIFLGDNSGANIQFASDSIFIGTQAGTTNPVNNFGSYDDVSTFAKTSILIGRKTSTGGFSNSIAMGAYATNTAANQFLIGSTHRPIDQFVMVGSGGTSCSLDVNGTACSSDQRLKTNITDLNSNVLDSLLKIKTVTFNWMSGVDQDRHIGFIAQDMQQYFPELVSTGSNGYLQVNYAGMTPVIVEAIRELNLKIANITTIADAQNQTLLDKIRTWLADTANGIEKITSHEIDVKQLCVSNDAGDKTCLTKEQVDHLLGSTPVPQNPAPAPQDPDPVPPQDDPNTDTPQDNVPVDTVVDSGGDEVPPVDTGDVTPPDENPPQETPTPDPLPQL